MTCDALIGTPAHRLANIPAPHAWRDSLLASLCGYCVTMLLLYCGMLRLAALHPSQPQLAPGMVAVVDLIDSLFGWGVLIVPIAFSFRTTWRLAHTLSLCFLASFIGLVVTGLETWMLFLDTRYLTPVVLYDTTGALNALLATGVLLALRRGSARHNGIEI